MNKIVRTSAALLSMAVGASLAACTVSDPYSQANGHSTNAPPSPQYAQSYMQPAFAQPVVYAQPVYAQPQYVAPAPAPAPYDRISQSESGSVSQGVCDRNLLATTATGAANAYVGAAAGPLVNGNIQAGMTPVDNGCLGLTLEYAHTNQPIAWQNPGTGTQYQVTPVNAYQAPNGLNCRQYMTVATINGRSERINDTACRLQSGLWQLES
jgi:surface antigen